MDYNSIRGVEAVVVAVAMDVEAHFEVEELGILQTLIHPHLQRRPGHSLLEAQISPRTRKTRRSCEVTATVRGDRRLTFPLHLL